MSTQDFSFLVINTKARWEAGDKKNLKVSEEGITLSKDPSHILEGEIGDSGPWLVATDIAVDACGLIYVLDAKRHCIFTYDDRNKRTERLMGIGGEGMLPGQFSGPQGIALSNDTLFVADTGNNRIQAFALINLQLRWIVETADSAGQPIPEGHPSGTFNPVALRVDRGGDLYVLDSQNLRVLTFDSGGRLKGKGVCAEGLNGPVSFALDEESYLYVLDAGKILKFGTDRKNHLVEPEFNLEGLGIAPSGLAVDPEGNVYVGDKREIKGEEERFIHKFDSAGNYRGPLLGYRGPCSGMVMDQHNNIYVITGGEEGKIAFLTFTRDRYFIKEPGTFISKPLDSTEAKCKWHKIVLDAEIQDKTHIDVCYHISDEEKTQEEILELPEAEWSQLPAFYTALTNLRDALIHGRPGRYLWLKLELISSDEYKTPKIKSIKAYFPRISYLRYLPAVYQEDVRSRDFLERFLSLFETFMTGTEDEVSHIARYFDADAAPYEFLSWLGSWVAAVFDEGWSEEKRRKFISRAAELYKKRGTREGLEDLIELYTGNKPLIVENFQLYRDPAAVDDESTTTDHQENDEQSTLEKLFGKPTPFSFCVLLKPTQPGIESHLKRIKRIVELEKPAHTTAGVVVLQPWVYLDLHTYLGINTYLSKPIMRLGITSVISRDTVLTDSEGAGQLERRSRLGIDTKLT